jgi:hypothetical protein
VLENSVDVKQPYHHHSTVPNKDHDQDTQGGCGFRGHEFEFEGAHARARGAHIEFPFTNFSSANIPTPSAVHFCK